MDTAPAGISEADWLLTPSAVRAFILAQQQEIEQLRERIGRSSRNSSWPTGFCEAVAAGVGSSTCARLPADVEAS